VVFTVKNLILILFITFTAFSQSCGPRLSSEAKEFLSQSEEVPECTTDFTYSNSINIAGDAKFFKQEFNFK
jgi:hypothetical protein